MIAAWSALRLARAPGYAAAAARSHAYGPGLHWQLGRGSAGSGSGSGSRAHVRVPDLHVSMRGKPTGAGAAATLGPHDVGGDDAGYASTISRSIQARDGSNPL